MNVNINLFEILIPAFKEKLGEKCPEEAVLKDIIASTGEVVANICNICIRSACAGSSMNETQDKINNLKIRL